MKTKTRKGSYSTPLTSPTPIWELITSSSSRTRDAFDWGLWVKKHYYGMWKAWASHAPQRRVDDRDAHTHRRTELEKGTCCPGEWVSLPVTRTGGRHGPELNESPVPLHLPCCIVGTRPESTGARMQQLLAAGLTLVSPHTQLTRCSVQTLTNSGPDGECPGQVNRTFLSIYIYCYHRKFGHPNPSSCKSFA